MDTMTRINVDTAALRDVTAALAAVGATIAEQYPTPGACGYTTIVLTTPAH